MPTRRTLVAALLAGGVGASVVEPLRSGLDRFAPLSGDVWDAATDSVPETVATPYGEATVRYDDQGVPTIAADDEDSLYFAVGYVHAADRLFQMDLIRRRMRGELSAAVGEQTVESDLFHRQMDFAAAAEANWELLSGTPAGEAVAAHAAGVNAFRRRRSDPLEFRLLGYEPEPWTPVDSMLIQKQISWGLTGDFTSLRRATIADAFGAETADRIAPRRYDHDAAILRSRRPDVSFADGTAGSAGGSGAGDLAGWLAGFEWPDGVGSNSWVVGGEHTESGLPLLANDPHLTLLAPPVWYEMHHELPDHSVSGVTFPGQPFVVIGENDAGAWGFTNAGLDVLDVYDYEIDGEQYRYGDEWRSFDTRTETVAVSGGRDREVTVRKTVHGPLLERRGQRVGVAWTGLTAGRTARAVRGLNRSDGRDEAVAALSMFDQPTQNAVYADRDGNTHYHVTGLVPIRRTDGEAVAGDRIFDGSAQEGEWAGYEPYGQPDFESDGWIPFEDKPHADDPALLATANQRVVADAASEYYLSDGYSAPWRGQRLYDQLDELVAADTPLTPADSRALQLDSYDRRAALFVPEILAARPAMTDRARSLADELVDWDFRMVRDSRAALVFALFLDHYRQRVFGPLFDAAGLDRELVPNDWVLLHLDADDPWFRDPPIGEPRERESLLAAAVADTAAEIDAEGYERYGDYNRTAIDHPFDLGFLNYPEYPTDGSPATLRNVRVESGVGSSYRLLARFDGERSLSVLPGGNDGDYFSDHYADQLRAWADGEYSPLTPSLTGSPSIRFRPGGGDSA
ncbi:penicillin acylase family protein [Halomicrobium sp. IBSBa]|uniref:penicillin acylase family protein n=1 Tax=Halomicrobium sp. IBSBa TaxID=2778916 RepID=UPI001ABFA22A|nr:penicillin acylase family protein [Halomicrobium sp. IBSBa]MBO4246916.1 penicillin acylase family protein [Halomicrobium sp. IBSBa]